MRFLLFILMVFLAVFPAQAEEPVLQGSVSKVWSVDLAREEAFKEARLWVNVSRFPADDPHRKQNLIARTLKRGKSGNRLITYFEMGGYSISEEGSDKGFYYTSSGQLFAIDFDQSSDYPIKSYKHAYPSGKLLSVSISVAPGDDYVFAPNGQLTAHWMGDQCFDALGTVTMTRAAARKPKTTDDLIKSEFNATPKYSAD